MSQDVTAVFDSGLNQVFAAARALKATISRDSKVMEHPVETGATITDHRIILPVSVELSLILSSEDYPQVYQEVKALFQAAELLTVQTRVDSFTGMLIEKMPHDETPELYDGIALALTLREVMTVRPEYTMISVAKPRDAKTVKRGQQQPTEAPPAKQNQGSTFAAAVDYLKGKK